MKIQHGGRLTTSITIREDFADLPQQEIDDAVDLISRFGLSDDFTILPNGELVAGEKFLLAVKLLSWDWVDCQIVRDATDAEIARIRVALEERYAEIERHAKIITQTLDHTMPAVLVTQAPSTSTSDVVDRLIADVVAHADVSNLADEPKKKRAKKKAAPAKKKATPGRVQRVKKATR